MLRKVNYNLCFDRVKRVRTDLTAHVSTLEEYFAMGMTGARTDEQRAMIEEAAERTQLNTSTVKVLHYGL